MQPNKIYSCECAGRGRKSLCTAEFGVKVKVEEEVHGTRPPILNVVGFIKWDTSYSCRIFSVNLNLTVDLQCQTECTARMQSSMYVVGFINFDILMAYYCGDIE